MNRKIPYSTALFLGFSYLVGIYFRFRYITTQIIIDDEMHSLRSVIHQNYQYILTHFEVADVCIPYTLLSKIIFDTIGLSEMALRFWALLCGLSLIVLTPFLVYRLFGWNTAIISSFLLSLSPLLILYSRYARPYSVNIFLVTVGVLCFLVWKDNGSRKWLNIYIVSSILSVYFHILSIAALLVPLVVDSILGTGRKQTLIQNARILAVILAGTAILLAPPFIVSHDQLFGKSGVGSFSWGAVAGSFMLYVGSRSFLLLSIVLVVAVSAIFTAICENRVLSIHLLSPFVSQLIAIVVLQPNMIDRSFVFARYLVWTIPLVMILIAHGLSILVSRMIQYRTACVLAVNLLIVLLFSQSLMPEMYSYHNDFLIPKQLHRFLFEDGNFHRSGFYNKIASDRDSYAIVEAPFIYYYQYFPYDAYQRDHGKEVFMGFVGQVGVNLYTPSEIPNHNSRFHFHQYVHLSDIPGVSQRSIRYIIIHEDIVSETEQTDHWNNALKRPPIDMTPAVLYCQKVFGPPVYSDDLIVVFENKISGYREQ